MSVTFTELQDAIAALAVPELRRIYTSRNVPNEMFSRLCPALIPDPDTPMIDSVSNRLTLDGRALPTSVSGVGWQRPRTLAYVCLTAEVGEARGAATHGERTALVWDALENALCNFAMAGLHHSGPVTLAGRFPVNDHSGKAFFGFTVRYSFIVSY